MTSLARPFDYVQVLYLVLPELLLILTALAVMAADLLVLRRYPHRTRFTAASILASLGCVAAIVPNRRFIGALQPARRRPAHQPARPRRPDRAARPHHRRPASRR